MPDHCQSHRARTCEAVLGVGAWRQPKPDNDDQPIPPPPSKPQCPEPVKRCGEGEPPAAHTLTPTLLPTTCVVVNKLVGLTLSDNRGCAPPVRKSFTRTAKSPQRRPAPRRFSLNSSIRQSHEIRPCSLASKPQRRPPRSRLPCIHGASPNSRLPIHRPPNEAARCIDETENPGRKQHTSPRVFPFRPCSRAIHIRTGYRPSHCSSWYHPYDRPRPPDSGPD